MTIYITNLACVNWSGPWSGPIALIAYIISLTHSLQRRSHQCDIGPSGCLTKNWSVQGYMYIYFVNDMNKIKWCHHYVHTLSLWFTNANEMDYIYTTPFYNKFYITTNIVNYVLIKCYVLLLVMFSLLTCPVFFHAHGIWAVVCMVLSGYAAVLNAVKK
jgi:hypothetical protein